MDPSPARKILRTFWRYAAANHDAIRSDLEQLPLSILKLNNVDSFWYQWRVFFMSVMFKHIPHKLLQKRPCHGLLRSLNPCVRSETCYSVKPSHQTLTLPGFPFVKPETKLCVPCELQRKIFYAISLSLFIIPGNFGPLTILSNQTANEFLPIWQMVTSQLSQLRTSVTCWILFLFQHLLLICLYSCKAPQYETSLA